MYVHCMTSHRTLFLNVFCSQICLHIIGVGTGGGDWGHVPPKVFNICHAHIACTWSIVVYYALAMSATQPSSESEPLPLKKLKQSTLTTSLVPGYKASSQLHSWTPNHRHHLQATWIWRIPVYHTWMNKLYEWFVLMFTIPCNVSWSYPAPLPMCAPLPIIIPFLHLCI